MKKTISKILALSLIFSATIFFTSCDPDGTKATLDNLGWYGIAGENGSTTGEDLGNIEDDIIFGSGDLPASIDLSGNFPPIGDQGSYGTCVAWAVGYNHKSYMEAVDAEPKLTTANYTTSNEYSPKYLFWAVPSASKGADCGGTGFEPAYDVLISKGITSLATTPYTSLGDCSGSTSQWDGTAGGHKIQSYREVELKKDVIKQYLAQGRALSFGAKLGDNFMSANSDAVHSSDTYGYSGQHAYHAMTLCGYDDSKNAFRIVNSWGPGWGDNGYLWVDYNFFTSEFAFCAFAATNIKSNPDEDDDNQVDDGDQHSGFDLMAWELEDLGDNGSLDRTAKYNAYNTGSEIIPAEKDWNILYVYYNATDANDYGILLYDYYSNDNTDGSWTEGENGDLGTNGDSEINQNWWNWVDIPAGQSVAFTVYGTNDVDDRFSWDYTMPSSNDKGAITGDYYLVIIVDGYNAITEYDESNNYFYLTDDDGGPLKFVDGVLQNNPSTKSYTKNMNPQIGEDNPYQSVITKQNLNTYSTKEIQTMLKHRLATGDIRRKAEAFLKTNKNTNRKTNN